jgi:MFS family permease
MTELSQVPDFSRLVRQDAAVTKHARPTYGTVLRNREFRGLFFAELLSVVGDRVALIAVALLVYEREGSALLAAVTYACSYLVYLVAGPFLSTLADRYPRRALMIGCDLARAAAVAVLLVPHPAVGLVYTVLVLVALLSAPFESARSATMPDVLSEAAYPVGNALQNSVFTIATAVGFGLGGLVVAGLGLRLALAGDATSFLVSALMVALFVRSRAPGTEPAERTSLLTETVAGARLVAGQPQLRWLLAVACIASAVMIPTEGLAVPTAAVLHGGATLAGTLSAAVPAGYVGGAFLVSRLDSSRRRQALLPLLTASALPLLLSRLAGTAPALLVLWVVAGAGSALQMIANVEYVLAVPREARGRAFGLASAALMGTQGLVLLGAGALAELLDPRSVVALAGLLGLCATPVLLQMRPQLSQQPQELLPSGRSPAG